MKIDPYGKNQLYTGLYKIEKGGKVELPEDCHWKVLKFQGSSRFCLDPLEEGEIALVLEDDIETEKKFWPLISFLTKEEARDLKEELEKALEDENDSNQL